MALQGVDSEASQEVKASEQPTERPGFAERPSERLTERPRVQETSRNHEKSRFWWVFVGFRHGIMTNWVPRSVPGERLGAGSGSDGLRREAGACV